MGFRDGLFRWSIPAGRWGGTAVRVSCALPLTAAAIALRERDLTVGAAAGAALCGTVAGMEAARRLASGRFAGGASGSPGPEVLLWPLGALEPPERPPVRPAWTHLFAPLGGFAVCGALWAAARLGDSPVRLSPAVTPAGAALTAAGVVTVANLLPAWPLALGRAVRDGWATRFGERAADDAVRQLTHLVGVLALFFSVAVGSAWLAAATAVTLLIARRTVRRPRPRRERVRDDTFLGYDFSAGYTSLPGDERQGEADGQADAEPDEVPPGGREPGETGWATQWRSRRDAARRRRERERREAAEADVDRLLRKISAEGEAALTAAERRTLKRASAAFRQGPAED